MNQVQPWRGITCLFFLILMSIPVSAAGADHYEQGRRFMETGEWKAGLQTWWSAKTDSSYQRERDIRVALAFIEYVTENDLEMYFGNASDLYLWAFSDRTDGRYLDDLCMEASRVAPLLAPEEEKEWNRRIKKKDPTLASDIHRFWLESDPRPTTTGNERLIEHWRRIAYARQMFQMNRNSVYDCDDRGLIYVKYGEPFRKKSGFLGSSAASLLELSRWLGPSRKMAQSQAEMRAKSNLIKGGFSSKVVTPEEDITMMNIKLWDPKPEYEVWLYTGLHERRSVIYLFSRENGTGPFELVDGVEEALPRVMGRSMGNYVPRLRQGIYQIMYYAELANFDDFFYHRYRDLEMVWDHAANNDRMPNHHEVKLLSAFNDHNRGEDKFNAPARYSMPERSGFELLTGSIEVGTHFYRFLDEQNEPELVVYTLSSPQIQAEYLVADESGRLGPPPYRLLHTLILRDDGLRELYRLNDQLSGSEQNMSVFRLPHIHQRAHFTVSSEAIYEPDTTGRLNNDLFPDILALGKESCLADAPLNRSRRDLELSDLVFGIEMPEDLKISGIPVPIIPLDRFAADDPVKMYLEIYHLLVDENGKGHGNIEYLITRYRDDEKKQKPLISSSFNYQTQGRRGRELVSLDISRLKPGDYEFHVRVTDNLSNSRKTRTARFSIEK